MHNQWLFFRDVLSHWVTSMSGIVSLLICAVEYIRKHKLEGAMFCVLAGLFLICAFDQAWEDEHRNADVLIGEKSALVSELEFWKQQSYQKDDAIHTRDQLLSKNYAALIGEQTTANNTQSSFSRLSEKILEVGKPQPLRVITQALMEPAGDGPLKVQYFIVLINKSVNPAIMEISCDQDITSGGGAVVGARQALMGTGPVIAKRRFDLSLTSPPWTPLSPVLLDVHYTGSQPSCGVEVAH
jgi:hypothetical protein